MLTNTRTSELTKLIPVSTMVGTRPSFADLTPFLLEFLKEYENSKWIKYDDSPECLVNLLVQDPQIKYLVTDGYDIRVCLFDQTRQEFYDENTEIAWHAVTSYSKLPKLPLDWTNNL